MKRHSIVALTYLFCLAFSCAEEPPSWEGFSDTEKEQATETGNTHGDTGGDSDIDTAPVVLPPGVVGAKKTTISAIDGHLTETSWDVSTAVTQVIEGSGNNTVLFGTLWDDFYLYIGIEVVDPNIHDDSLMTWQDDSVEVFIDGNYSQGTSYDKHDIQYWIECQSNMLTVKNDMPRNAKHSLVTIDSGYTAELAVPWKDIEVTPHVGMKIGFDVGVNDDDDGGDRDAHHMWNGDDDNWTDTSAFGTLILQ